MQAGVSASETVAVGSNALYSNISGIRNVAIGTSSLTNNTTGSGNLALGYEAGAYNTEGSYNVFLGFQAGANETGSNKLYIGSSGGTLMYGDFSTGQVDLGKTSGTVTTLNDFNVDGDATFDGTATITGASTLTGAVTQQHIRCFRRYNFIRYSSSFRCYFTCLNISCYRQSCSA